MRIRYSKQFLLCKKFFWKIQWHLRAAKRTKQEKIQEAIHKTQLLFKSILSLVRQASCFFRVGFKWISISNEWNGKIVISTCEKACLYGFILRDKKCTKVLLFFFRQLAAHSNLHETELFTRFINISKVKCFSLNQDWVVVAVWELRSNKNLWKM